MLISSDQYHYYIINGIIYIDYCQTDESICKIKLDDLSLYELKNLSKIINFSNVIMLYFYLIDRDNYEIFSAIYLPYIERVENIYLKALSRNCFNIVEGLIKDYYFTHKKKFRTFLGAITGHDKIRLNLFLLIEGRFDDEFYKERVKKIKDESTNTIIKKKHVQFREQLKMMFDE